MIQFFKLKKVRAQEKNVQQIYQAGLEANDHCQEKAEMILHAEFVMKNMVLEIMKKVQEQITTN